jgi:uncharacterized membrane protein YeaQ/YmgE (transglycosylase-associated protein family)
VNEMSILILALLGLVAGWLASVIMGTNSSQGILMDIVFGVLGAVVGGLIMNIFGQPGATGFNLYSILVATAGAVLLIWIGRRLQRT